MRPGLRRARFNSLRYVWHQTREYVESIARTPTAPSAYARLGEVWGLQTLVPGRVYRAAEPRPWHFAHVEALGIRTLLCVKRTLPVAPTLSFAKAHGIHVARVDLGADTAIDLAAIARVLDLLERPELWPILLHCDGGRHRTGMVSAALRREQGWSLEAALAEYCELAEPTPRESDRAAIRAWFQAPQPKSATADALAFAA